MLILTRFPGEAVDMIASNGENMKVTVLGVGANGVVRLGFDGPPSVTFMRDNAKTRSLTKEQGNDQEDDNRGNR